MREAAIHSVTWLLSVVQKSFSLPALEKNNAQKLQRTFQSTAAAAQLHLEMFVLPVLRKAHEMHI